jgi:CPA2 family monovalent cation:H+ antiporter-2
MPYGPSLVATIVVSLALACACGMAARMLRLPPLVGYLVAGVVVGPFTPGIAVDQVATAQLAEIGVALLLFGIGLHFSVADLAAVWRIAVPGALLQIAISSVLGFGVGRWLGFTPQASIALGFSLAVASTAVATRALEQRGLVQAQVGRVALGWLVMQDLVVVLELILLPEAIGNNGAADTAALAVMIGIKLLEVGGFLAGMLLLGRRLIPWALALTARDGSRELFRLAVIVVALGVAYLSAHLIGVSFALGAFFAGVVVAESDVSHQAGAELTSVQQIFTVLFFVSVGMLFDPDVVIQAPVEILTVVGAVVLGNGLITLTLLLALRAMTGTAVAVAALLAQIGEFSFILTEGTVNRGILPAHGRDLVLAAALLAILVNPFVFQAAARLGAILERSPRLRRWRRGPDRKARGEMPELVGHAIIVGHGRVGSVVAAALGQEGLPYVVIEQNFRSAEQLRREGVPAVYGDAGWPEVLSAARPEKARLLVIAVPDRSAARRVIAAARAANPQIDVVVRTHTGDEAEWLAKQSVGRVVMTERQAAKEMAAYALERFASASDSNESPSAA